MIYIAVPYSHKNKETVLDRVEKFCRADAIFIASGLITVSPISKHFILDYQNLPGNWIYWQRYSFELLKNCKGIIVLMLEGWEESIGVACEIEYAKNSSIPIYYCDYNELLLNTDKFLKQFEEI